MRRHRSIDHERHSRIVPAAGHASPAVPHQLVNDRGQAAVLARERTAGTRSRSAPGGHSSPFTPTGQLSRRRRPGEHRRDAHQCRFERTRGRPSMISVEHATPPVVEESVLEDLRARLRGYRRVDVPAGFGWARGVDGDRLADLISHWASMTVCKYISASPHCPGPIVRSR
uniref:Epoxide hydrolase 1 n=1 Tax=Streptomyces hygroscopicus TaxID=1912 RepID=D5MEG8_STRHY|nr:epoxide hydrolase 1 [Streptomyces hygroscopicus]